MFKTLELSNFKKHAHYKGEFANGLTVIKGSNYAGKSTLCQAIMVALYGASAAPGKKENLIRHGAKDYTIQLALTLPSHGLVVISRSSKNAVVYNAEGKLLASGHSPVTQFVTDNLNSDLKLFSLLHYSRQGETQVLLTLGVTVLQRTVEDLCGVDMIDDVITKVSKSAVEYRGLLQAVPMPDLDQLRLSVSEVNSELEAAIQAYDRNQAEATRLKDERAETLFKLRQIEAHNQKVNRLRREFGNLVTKEQELINRITSARQRLSLLPTVQIHDSLQLRTEQLRQELEAAVKVQAEIKQHRIQFESINDWLQRTGYPERKKQQEFYRVQTELEAQRAAAEKEMVRLRTAVKHDQDELNSVMKMLDQVLCRTCGQALSDANVEEMRRQVAALQERLYASKSALARAEYAYSQVKSKLMQLELPMADYTAWVEREETSSKEHQQQLQYLQQLKTRSPEQIREEYEPLAKQLAEASRTTALREHLVDDIATMEQDLDTATAAKEQCRSALQEVGPTTMETFLLERQYQAAEVDWHKTTEQSLELMNAKAGAETRLKHLQHQLKVSEELAERHQGLAKTVTTHEGLLKYLRGSRARFLDTVWTEIMRVVSAVVQAAIPDITEVRYTEGSFSYMEDKREYAIESASGAQRSMIGIALRLAMSELFYGLKAPLILDEPSADMQDEVAASLAGVLLATGRQVIVVSHRMSEELTAGQVLEL